MTEARILVVEDEAVVATHISSSLDALGYEVCAVVTTGEDAIRVADDLFPDLVVMDVVLAGEMDGISAAQRIQSAHPIPVIFLTAYSDEEMLARATAAGPFGYLIKPFRERELHSTITMALFKYKLEKQLRESREWFLGTLKSLGEAVIATDREGNIIFINPAAESVTYLTEEEVRGKPLRDFFPTICERVPDSSSQDRSPTVRTDQSPAIHMTCDLTTLRGSHRTIDACLTPIKGGRDENIGSVLIFRDVTRSKSVEQRLRLLYEAIEQCSEGIALADHQGVVKFANKAFAAMHGYAADEITGLHYSTLHTEDQMPMVNEACHRTIKDGLFSGEIWHKKRDGKVFPALAHNAVLRDQAGQISGIIGTLRDITEVKRAEDALRASHEALAAYSADLEAKVEERTRDLENSREELARYSESLEKTNEALKIIIEGIETQKKDFEEKIKQSINLTVRPILEQLNLQDTSETVAFLIKSLEFNIANLFSSFSFDLMRDAHVLTPREARICEMIRAGLSSKQIAKVMNISPQTVLVHRKNIRKKLGVDRSRRNLASFLKART